ncbi:MAG: nitrilase-related carbon-nitrogen hydrolase [Methanobacteriota archaeon]
MNVGFVQFNPRHHSPRQNCEKILRMLEGESADLIVLPELFSTGYAFSSKKELYGLSEEVPDGPTTSDLISLSKKIDACIVAGIAEKSGSKVYNSAVVVDKDYVGVYRKVHLFGREKEFFEPGDEFKVFDVRGIKLGVMVCFDWFFPESARTLALLGADLIAHPANLIMPYCPDAMVTRCLENGVWAVTADRIGQEGEYSFIGQSQVTSPTGEVLYRASADKEDVKVFHIDVSLARFKDLNDYNNIFNDRKPACYKLK